MIFSTDLSLNGYELIKKDRNKLKSHLDEIQNSFNDIDALFQYLKGIFEPVFVLKTEGENYIGSFEIHFPIIGETKEFSFLIGPVNEYSGPKDDSLLKRMEELGMEKIKVSFPLNFGGHE
jgi:hypothetical protein